MGGCLTARYLPNRIALLFVAGETDETSELEILKAQLGRLVAEEAYEDDDTWTAFVERLLGVTNDRKPKRTMSGVTFHHPDTTFHGVFPIMNK